MKSWHLELLGVPSLVGADGRVVTLERRDAAMLAQLAIAGATSRARLLTLLWPHEDESRVRNRLRQRVFALKRKLGAEVFEGQLTLSLGACITWPGLDPEASDRPLLGDDAYLDLPEFAQWLGALRERLQGLRRERLARTASALETDGRLAEAIVVAEQLLAHEPLQEHAHRRLMRLHYLRGDRADALLAFDRCEQALKDAVSARPSAETLALLATIESEREVRAPAAARPMPAGVLRPPRMVGRDRELAQLEAVWLAGHVAALTGEAGMGKSRLLQAFAQRASGIVQIAAQPGDAGVPFATLARLLRGAAEQACEPAPALGTETRHEIAQLLPELAPAPPRRADGQRVRLRDAVREFLAHFDVRGVVVDDLHFADGASLEMLRSLIDSDGAGPAAAAMRWALALRPAEAGTPLQQLQRELIEGARLVTIGVAPLSAPALAQLVDDLALPGVRGGDLATMLLRRTGGNPLFVLETLKQAWVDRSLGQLADGIAPSRPESVGQLIEARVARLSRPALALARVAGIAGSDFGIPLAEHVLATNAMQLADALGELETAQVMSGARFAHDLVYEAVLRSIPQAIAVHTHAQVALWLEQHEGEPARVAHHWVQAQAPVRAIPQLMSAAERSASRTCVAEARAFLEQAAAMCVAADLPDTEFDVLLALHDNYTLDDPGAAHDALTLRLDTLARTPLQRFDADLTRANLQRRRLRPAPASELLNLVARAESHGETERVVGAVNLLVGTLLPTGQTALAAQLLFRYERYYAVSKRPQALADFHADLSGTFGSQDRFDEALLHNTATTTLRRRVGQHDEVMATMGNRARILRMQGRMEAACALSREIDVWHASAAPNRRSWLTSRVGAFDALRELSRYGEAMDIAERHFAEVEAHVGFYYAQMPVTRATMWLALGQAARANEVLGAARVDGVARAPDWLRARFALMRVRVAVRLRAGAGPDRPSADDLDALARASASAPRAVRRASWFECELQRAAWVDARAGAALAECVDTLATAHGMFGYARTARLRVAQRLLDDGNAAEALRWLGRADDLAEHRFFDAEASEPIALAALDESEGAAIACRVLSAAADGRADARTDAALERLHRIARDHVRAEFRDSFLHHNPVHRELIGLAARRHS